MPKLIVPFTGPPSHGILCREGGPVPRSVVPLRRSMDASFPGVRVPGNLAASLANTLARLRDFDVAQGSRVKKVVVDGPCASLFAHTVRLDLRLGSHISSSFYSDPETLQGARDACKPRPASAHHYGLPDRPIQRHERGNVGGRGTDQGRSPGIYPPAREWAGEGSKPNSPVST